MADVNEQALNIMVSIEDANMFKFFGELTDKSIETTEKINKVFVSNFVKATSQVKALLDPLSAIMSDLGNKFNLDPTQFSEVDEVVGQLVKNFNSINIPTEPIEMVKLLRDGIMGLIKIPNELVGLKEVISEITDNMVSISFPTDVVISQLDKAMSDGLVPFNDQINNASRNVSLFDTAIVDVDGFTGIDNVKLTELNDMIVVATSNADKFGFSDNISIITNQINEISDEFDPLSKQIIDMSEDFSQFGITIDESLETVIIGLRDFFKIYEQLYAGSKGSVESFISNVHMMSKAHEQLGIGANESFGSLQSSMLNVSLMSEKLGGSSAEPLRMLQSNILDASLMYDVLGNNASKAVNSINVENLGLNKIKKDVEGITKAIDVKNKGHKDELGLVKDESKEVAGISNKWVGVITKQIQSLNTLKGHIAIWSAIIDKVMEADEATENFVTTNYRLYGSQNDLLRSSRMISAEWGVSADKAITAIMALSNLSTPKDQMNDYAEAIVKGNRYLGVSIEQLADFSRGNRLAGGDAKSFERMLGYASDAMRKYGLNTNEVGDILNNTGKRASELILVFGKQTKDGRLVNDVYAQQKLQLAGLAKSYGMSAKAATDYYDRMMTPMGQIRLSAFVGKEIKSLDDYDAAIKGVGLALEKQYGLSLTGFEAATAGMSAAQKQARYLGVAKAAGLETVDELHFALKQADELKKAGVTSATDFAGIMRVTAEAAGSLTDPYSEANDTLTAQLSMMKNTIENLLADSWTEFSSSLKEVVKFLNSVLVPVIKFAVVPMIKGFASAVKILISPIRWLNGIISGMSDVFNRLSQWFDVLAKKYRFLAAVGSAIQFFYVIIKNVIAIIPFAIGLVSGLVFSFRSITLALSFLGRLRPLLSFFSSLAPSLASGLGMLGRVFFRVLARTFTVAALVGIGMSLIKYIVQGIKMMFPEFYKIGENLLQSLWDGIKDVPILGWLLRWAGTFISWFEQLFGIASPSKVMSKIGDSLIMGLWEGLKNAPFLGKIFQLGEKIKEYWDWFWGAGTEDASKQIAQSSKTLTDSASTYSQDMNNASQQISGSANSLSSSSIPPEFADSYKNMATGIKEGNDVMAEAYTNMLVASEVMNELTKIALKAAIVGPVLAFGGMVLTFGSGLLKTAFTSIGDASKAIQGAGETIFIEMSMLQASLAAMSLVSFGLMINAPRLIIGAFAMVGAAFVLKRAANMLEGSSAGFEQFGNAIENVRDGLADTSISITDPIDMIADSIIRLNAALSEFAENSIDNISKIGPAIKDFTNATAKINVQAEMLFTDKIADKSVGGDTVDKQVKDTSGLTMSGILQSLLEHVEKTDRTKIDLMNQQLSKLNGGQNLATEYNSWIN